MGSVSKCLVLYIGGNMTHLHVHVSCVIDFILMLAVVTVPFLAS